MTPEERAAILRCRALMPRDYTRECGLPLRWSARHDGYICEAGHWTDPLRRDHDR